MTWKNRLSLLYRSLLFLLTLLGIPAVARCDTVDNSAKDLAQKIAAVLPARSEVALVTTNLSSLTSDEASRAGQKIREELQSRGIAISTNATVVAKIDVTFSENGKGLVWTAQIIQGDSQNVVLTQGLRLSADRSPPSASMALRADRFEEFPYRILDETPFTDPAGRIMDITVTASAIQTQMLDSVSVAQLNPPEVSRDPQAIITTAAGSYEVDFDSRKESEICTFSPPSGSQGSREQCGEVPAKPLPKPPALDGVPRHGDQVAEIHSSCGPPGGTQELITGPGDYTEPDTIQAYEFAPGGARIVPVAKPVAFSGPVLALHSAGTGTATAIVLNLKTGNYEVYHLSISCTQ